MSKSLTGLTLATAAAALFTAGATLSTAVQAADTMTVKCTGVNSCKGSSECKTATSACKGQNACKGHGWVNKASAKECEAAGGKVAK
jgi:hypothetical protein